VNIHVTAAKLQRNSQTPSVWA